MNSQLKELNSGTSRLPQGYELTSLQSLFVEQSNAHSHSIEASTGYVLKISGLIDQKRMVEAAALCAEYDPFLLSRYECKSESRAFDHKLYRTEPTNTRLMCPVVDLSRCEDPIAKAESLAEDLILKPYRPTQDDLVRFCLVKLSDTEHHLVIACHHSILDGSSLNILANRCIDNYQSLSRPQEISNKPIQGNFPQPSFQEYVDLLKQKSGRHLEFWKRKLSTASPLALLSDSSEPNATPSRPWNTYSTTLDSERSTELRKFCRSLGVTPSLLFKSLYGLLIQAYAGAESDFIVMEVVSDRPRQHHNNLGCYIQKIPLLFPVTLLTSEDSGLTNMLDYLKQYWRSTKGYRNLPSIDLQSIIDQSTHEFCYNYYRYQEPNNEGDLTLSHYGAATPLKNTIQLIVTESSSGEFKIHCCHYHKDFLDHHFVQRISLLIDQILDEDIVDLKSLRLLTDQEQNEISLVNNTESDADLSVLAHHRFESFCERSPNAIAAIDEQHTFTYAELNTKANQVAASLIQAGINKGDRVGVLLTRSAKLPAAVLGILKIGACYAPFDREYPKARIHHMVEDSKPKVILVESVEQAFAKLESNGASFLAIDECFSAPASALPQVDISANDNAYVIYTSGSTGLPKGAINHHGGMINHILAERSALELEGAFTMLQNAPLSSDISVWQILGPLTCGGATITLAEGYNIAKLIALIKDHAIDVVEAVPAVVAQLVEHLETHRDFQLEHLKHLMITGEAAPAALINQWLLASNGIPITNAYGPSETADDVAQHTFDSPLPNNTKYVSIGRPIANTHVYILDQLKRLLPPHYAGEIAVAGVCVGNGYINNPEETEARFITHPFCQGKLYLTGDLGWWSQDYYLYYKNRRDFQLNLNGRRIEPLEIEHAIRKEFAVNECAVAKTRLDNDEEQLIAYYKSAKSISTESFHNTLSRLLPGYMVPALYMQLDKFPLTPVGKLDRHSLPTPSIEALSYVAPATPMEKMVATIWEEVLRTKNISTDAYFHALGGNSLTASKLAVRLRDRHQYDVSIKTVLSKPTIKRLAAHLETL